VVRTFRLASLALVAGCTSLSGLSGSDTDAGSDGSAPDAKQDATLDAGSDAPADSPVEAAVDAGPDATWCSQQVPTPRFCDDFDRPTPIGFGWLRSNSPGRTLEETRTFVSAPRSFLSQLLPCAGTGQYAQLGQAFAGPLGEVHVELAIRIGDLDGGASGLGRAATWTTKGSRLSAFECLHMLEVTSTSAQLHLQWIDANGDTQDDILPMTAYPVPGQWMTMSIDFTTGTSGAPVETIKIGGTPALAATALPPCQFGGEFDFHAGIFFTDAPFEVRFDNVKFDGK